LKCVDSDLKRAAKPAAFKIFSASFPNRESQFKALEQARGLISVEEQETDLLRSSWRTGFLSSFKLKGFQG